MLLTNTLRHKVDLQYLIEGYDEIGQPIQEWETLIRVSADIRFLSGLEAVKAGSEVSVTKASIRIRKPLASPFEAPSGGIAAMRVNHDGELFNIVAALPAETHIDLICEKVN